MPTRAEACERLLAIADERTREVEVCREDLAAGEAEVDAFVAELYGLDDDDPAVIEDFLERF